MQRWKEDWRKKNTHSPPSSSPPPASLTFYLFLSSFLLLPFSPFPSSPMGWGWEGSICKEERERSSFNLPHSCDHLQLEAPFSSASNQIGEREGEGEKGKV
ncbi:hypothetical protein CRENBAI_019903 [Crenichthys baileyi]|uniref:Uncharacterized protein n=1 Tax=Crenichthys baileyi TaxID=28760 RepID=A0AAV9SRV2_9TELE